MDNEKINRIEFYVKLKYEDYLSFNYLHIKNSLINTLLGYGFLIVFLFPIWLLISFSIQKTLEALVVIATILGIFYILKIYDMFFGLKKASRKIFNSDKIMQKEEHFVIDNRGVKTSHDESISLVKWDEIYCINETKKHFFIYISMIKAVIIPKRCLTDPEQINRLRTLFTECVNSKQIRFKNRKEK